MPEPTILAFDTSAAHCAAALLSGDRVLAETFEEMNRGQAERLMPVLDALIARADLSLADLDAIAVGVGPGNFTGIRIAVAAARGLSMGLGIPAIGVSTFRAMAPAGDARCVVALAAPRGQVYLQAFEDGSAVDAPAFAEAIPPEERLVVADAGLDPPMPVQPGPDWPARVVRMGALAAGDLARGTALPPPAPLYVRAADAAPARAVPPVR